MKLQSYLAISCIIHNTVNPQDLSVKLEVYIKTYFPYVSVVLSSYKASWNRPEFNNVVYTLLNDKYVNISDFIEYFPLSWMRLYSSGYDIDFDHELPSEDAIWSRSCAADGEVFLIPEIRWVKISTWQEFDEYAMDRKTWGDDSQIKLQSCLMIRCIALNAVDPQELLLLLDNHVNKYFPQSIVSFCSSEEYWKFPECNVYIYNLGSIEFITVADFIKSFSTTWSYDESCSYSIDLDCSLDDEEAIWAQNCYPEEIFFIPGVEWVNIYTWQECEETSID